LEALVMFEVELPYPPSINHYWRRVGPRTLISREGRRFRQRVMAILAARRVEPLQGPLAVEVEIHPPDHRRRDIDNVQKALLDALQHGGAYEDDSQIIDLHARKCAAAPAGKVRVTLRQIEGGGDGDSRLGRGQQARPGPGQLPRKPE
jgi:Holliday junction resolvase RusA-like endonuclease